MATAALSALRHLLPDAHITWAVGDWSARVIADHPDVDALLITGAAANPAQGLGGLRRFARQLRGGSFDLAISLVRSPWTSLAFALSGIPQRVGLDSGGRGFGYTLRVPVDPTAQENEAAIYLRTIAALGADSTDYTITMPVAENHRASVHDTLRQRGINGAYCVLNPAGGGNPGMVMSAKRWPPAAFAQVGDALADQLGLHVILLGGPDDGTIVDAVRDSMQHTPTAFVGDLSFGEIAALAAGSSVYIGNDTGLTHLAAATGAPTVMIFGPSDPARYAPFVPDALALWQRVDLRAGGVSASQHDDWDWARDGIRADDAIPQILDYVRRRNAR